MVGVEITRVQTHRKSGRRGYRAAGHLFHQRQRRAKSVEQAGTIERSEEKEKVSWITHEDRSFRRVLSRCCNGCNVMKYLKLKRAQTYAKLNCCHRLHGGAFKDQDTGQGKACGLDSGTRQLQGLAETFVGDRQRNRR